MTRLAEHRQRAGALILGVPFDETRLRREATALDEEHALSLYVLLVERTSAFRGWSGGGGRLFTDLNRRPLPWTAQDVTLVFDLTRGARDGATIPVLKAAVAAAERLDGACRAECVTSFERALVQIGADDYEPAARARLRMRLRALIESADPSAPGAVRTAVFDVKDGWGPAAVERLSPVTTDVDAVSELLAHAGAIPSGPRPTKAWLKRTGELLADRPAQVALVRDLLELAYTCRPVEVESWGFRTSQRIGPDNAGLVRGLLWAALVGGEPWLTQLVLALYASRPEQRVLNTCFAVLGRRADAAAIAALVRLQRETRDRAELAQIASALDEVAATAGISPSELTEQTVPDAGLDRRRERRVVGADVTAVLALDGQAKVRLIWEHGDARTARPPAHADPHLVTELKRDAAGLRKLVAGERSRLEDLLVEEREWPLHTWRQRYADHPVTGAVANRLIWRLIDGDHVVTALPAGDGRFTRADGGTIDPGDGWRVGAWHPALADPEQVRTWRAHIMARELVQPFKQAFREVYLPTPAEQETRLYSNRFAAHVLRYQQTFALMKERRWHTNYLGGWDGGYEGEAKREFPSYGLRAVFRHEPAGVGPDHQVQYCTTGQVRFQRLRGRAWEDVPLTDVPLVVFSEGMRDVDLFVGVTSIANDPTWADRGADDDRFAYWRDTAFGELTANGQVRRQVIEHLLPKLKIRDRARLEGNYLVVDGRKHSYKIHVGSANVLMSPNDQYLCIVPARQTMPAGVRFVPFEGDGMLSLVLSKALLLADDHRITDPSIVSQIG